MRRWAWLGLVLGLLLAVGAGSASGASRRAAARAVRAAPVAKPGPVLTFYFGLRRPERKAVAAFWAVQRPGSASYRRFLTPAQLARRFGAPRATRHAFVAAMRRLGLTASVDRTGVFARVRGTQAQLQRAFHVKISATFDDLATSYAPTRPLRLPAAVKPLVREVVAASVHTTLHPGAGLSPLVMAPAGPTNQGRWIGGCAAARKTGGYGYAQIRHAYGIARVGSGAGGSMAILNDQETVSRSESAELDRCFGYPGGRLRSLFTDGQTHRFLPETPEPVEDLDVTRGIAPQLHSVVQTEVWGAPELWFLGPDKLLTQRRLPDALSISYGYCEPDVMSNRRERAGSRLLNAMFVRLGLAGVGVFGSAGDSGSTCNGKPHLGSAWPADSPYVTSVGGTRLVVDRANRRVREVVWNDLRWLKPSNGGGAGGGGLASGRRPPYQRRIRVKGDARATPDIAVHASMLPGYPIYANGQWILDGGTSAAAPLAAAAFSALSARQQASGKPPLGPVNGLLYWLARHHRSALYDIVAGDNRYSRHVRGYRAHRGYDLASGLGVPQLHRIAAMLPAPARR